MEEVIKVLLVGAVLLAFVWVLIPFCLYAARIDERHKGRKP